MPSPACARMETGAGSGLGGIESPQRIVEFLEMRMPEGLIGKLKMLPKLAEVGAFFPEDGVERAVPGSCAPRGLFA